MSSTTRTLWALFIGVLWFIGAAAAAMLVMLVELALWLL